MVWPCTNFSRFLVTEAEFKRTDSESSIGRCRMTNQSRSKGRDAEVPLPQASCRTTGREAHDDTTPKDGARRVQEGVEHGQQGEGVKGTIPPKDYLSQGPKELVSCGQSRVCEAI